MKKFKATVLAAVFAAGMMSTGVRRGNGNRGNDGSGLSGGRERHRKPGGVEG